jgi:hypothetical protein
MCPRPTDIIKDMIDIQIEKALKNEPKSQVTLPYNTINEYKQVTGKRFRRTKDQMQRDLSQREAFNEHLESVRQDLLESLDTDEE